MAKQKTMIVAGGGIVLLMMVLGGLVRDVECEQIVSKWAGFHPVAEAQMQYMYKVKEAVEQRVGGGIKIEMFPGGSLVKGREMLEALRGSLIDCGFVIPGYYPAQLPLSYWGYLVPFGPTADTMYSIIDEVRPIVEKEYEANGLKLMELLPFRLEWYFNRAINLDEPDWSGMKLRPLGGLSEVMCKNLGAGAVSMSSTEAGVALSTKVIDGILTSLNTYYHTGIYKSAIYAFVSKANYSLLNAYCFSLSRWNKLPKDIQNILREEFTRVKHKWYVDYARNTDEKILNEVKSEGVEMMIPTRDQLKIWRKKMASTWHVLPEKTGPGGKEYLDIVERYCK